MPEILGNIWRNRDNGPGTLNVDSNISGFYWRKSVMFYTTYVLSYSLRFKPREIRSAHIGFVPSKSHNLMFTLMRAVTFALLNLVVPVLAKEGRHPSQVLPLLSKSGSPFLCNRPTSGTRRMQP